MRLSKNLTYFDKIDTEVKAYFLGLLYSDGNVSSNGCTFQINLKATDKAVLERLSQEIFGTVRLRTIKPHPTVWKGKLFNSREQSALTVSSKYMVAALNRLGVIPRKSLTLRFPTSDQVPDHLLRHFVRGYFDGDGCITHDHGFRIYRLSIQSSKDFCAELIERVRPIEVDFKWIYEPSKIHEIGIGGNRHVKRFADWIYEDATIYLERKWLKYQNLLKRIEAVDNRKSSRYKGVSYFKRLNRWTAHALPLRPRIYIGSYPSELEAYEAQQAFMVDGVKRDRFSRWDEKNCQHSS